MNLWSRLRSWVRTVLRRSRAEHEMEAEVQFHIEALADDLMRSGIPREEALRKARIEFGGVERVKEECREAHGFKFMEDLLYDLRFAGRVLRKSPGFAVIVILTLAIAVGANTVIFSLVNGVLLKPLSYPNPDQLIAIDHSSQQIGFEKMGIAPALYFVYREQNTTLEDIGAYDNDELDVTVAGTPEHVRVLDVTDGTLPILGVSPVLGRLFTRHDDSPGATQTVVLTYPYWQRRFDAASTVIGSSITVNGAPAEIIGVLPQSFHFLDQKDPSLILPMQWDRAKTTFGSFEGNAIARLKPGVSVKEATTDLERLLPVAMRTFPPPAGVGADYFQSMHLKPTPIALKDEVIGNVQNVLWVLLASTILVLLVACANVANLLTIRVEGRHHEFAIRYAIGAARRRISADILFESGLLAIAGGLIGLLLAFGAMRIVVALGATNIPRIRDINITPSVLVFAITITAIASLLIACVPILKSTNPRLITDLRDGGRAAGQGRRAQGARKALVMIQVAVSVILLICSGLMIRTFRAMMDVSPGFTSPETIQAFGFYIPDTQIPDSSPELVIRMDEAIVRKITSIPGVSSVSIGRSLPLDGNDSNNPVFVENRTFEGSEIPPSRRFNYLAPGFFSTLGTRLLAGRDFTWADNYDKTPVVIVSKSFANEFWRRPEDALGKRVRMVSTDPWREIIGVSEDVHYDGVEKPSPSMVYWPLLMDHFGGHTRLQRATVFVVRSQLAGTQSLMNSIQQQVSSVNPSVPLANSGTLGHLYSQSMARTTFTLVMLCVSGGIALLLGIVGIYGVIAYSVSQRTREMGIRMALGAERRSISFMVLRQGAFLVLIGIAVGLIASLFVAQLIRTLLYGIQPIDPVTFVTVPVLLLAVAFLASYLPAWRASRVDPMVALRYE
jgi:predicted permease